MGRYLHGGVNITGFQLLEPDSKQLKEFMEAFSRRDKLTYPGDDTLTVLYGSRQAITCLRTYAACADSDHPAHVQTIIGDFSLHWYIL